MRKLQTVLPLALLVMMSCAAFASGTEEAPSATPQFWQGTLYRGKVRAAIRIQCPEAERGRASFRLTGLQPGALYSFWLIQDGKPLGLGKAPFQARADAHGNLDYAPRISVCPSESLLTVEVDRQASPKRRVVVLRGTIAAAP